MQLSNPAGRRLLGRSLSAALVGTLACSALSTAAFAGTAKVTEAHKVPTAAQLKKSLTALEAAPSGSVKLSETGSSLFYPLFSVWAQRYPHSNVSIQTASTGSGTGQSGALAGTASIGASDAYLPAGDPSTLLNVPIVVSAQQINYNVPGVKGHIKLNASVINSMYTGAITNWDDPAVKKLNPGLQIPPTPVVPIHRSDGSGDTFLFSSYLAAGDPGSFVASTGPNTTVNWPDVSSALAEKGNTGMLQTCAVTHGCIAYIGVSYLRNAIASGLGYAAVENGKHNYELPGKGSIAAEIASYKNIPANGTISLIDSPKAAAGYPIVNFEYAIVQQHQPDPATAKAIVALLAWGMDSKGGAAPGFLLPINFQPLPANAEAVAINQLKSIS